MDLRRRIFGGIFFLFIMFFLECNNGIQEKRDIVAEVGKEGQITFKELAVFVQKYFYDKRFRDIKIAYNKALDHMITNQLERIDFIERGLDNDDELLKGIARTINEEIIVEYFKSEYLGKYTNDSFVYQTYQGMSREVEYQQIVLKKPRNAKKEDLELIKKKAEQIKSELDQGVDFTECVHRYSQDQQSASQDGYMPPIKWKNRSTKKNSTIFNYNQGDVFLVETEKSFFLVKVTNINKITMEPYDKMKSEIKEDNAKVYMDISLEEYEKDNQILTDENVLNWDRNSLNQLLKFWRIQNFLEDDYRTPFTRIINESGNRTILEYPGGKVDYIELLRLLDTVLIPKSSQYSSIENIKEYILEAVRTNFIVQKAQSLGYRKNILNPNTDNTVIKYNMVQLYRQKVIKSQIPEPTEEALQQFYKENMDSLYYQLEKINIHVLQYKDKNVAFDAWKKVKNGADFKDVSDRWAVKTYIKERNGKIRINKEKDSEVLAELAFPLKKDETKGIIEYVDPEKGKLFAIIKCSHHRYAKQLTFGDVQKNIEKDFKVFNEKRIQQEIAKDLRNKYRVVVHRKVLNTNLKAIK